LSQYSVPGRARQRAKGLRQVQFWLPDTSTPEFAAQVAHAIAVAKAAEEAASPEERAEWDAWERAGMEGWPEWTGPDLTKPDDKA
jgi:antidote-toxin recognition MazE-like antitoxin